MIESLELFSRRVFSQEGEDGIIEAILGEIGTTNKYFIEFGVADGTICNTRYLLEQGWNGLMMDAAPDAEPGATVGPHVVREFVTAENINDLFDKYNVPNSVDVLSIDIDGNDYWVWKAIQRVPRVVVIEYNAKWQPPLAKAIPYDPQRRWNHTDYFGASLAAMYKLGLAKGYTLVGCDPCGVNAYFVLSQLTVGHFKERSLEEIYQPFGFPPAPIGDGPWLEV